MPPISQNSTPAPPSPTGKKSRRGCWVSFFATIAILAATLYYIIYHTAIPARFFVSQATEKDTFEAEEISGSIASGTSSIGVMRIDTGGGTMSEFHGLEVNYPKSDMFAGGKLNIDSITLDRVVLYLDSQYLARSKESETGSSQSPTEKKRGSGFRLGSLTIPDVTIHFVDLGWTFDFPHGLTITRVETSELSMSVGGIALLGEALHLEIPPFTGAVDKVKPATLPVTLTITPALDPSVVQNIRIHLTQTFLDEKPHTTEIIAFDSQFKTGTLPAAENRWFLHAQDLTVSDYVTGWFPGSDLSIEATYDAALGQFVALTSGSFMLKGQPWTLAPFQDQPTTTLHATTSTGESLTITFADGFAAPQIQKH